MHLRNAKFNLFGHLANLLVNGGWIIVTVLQTTAWIFRQF